MKQLISKTVILVAMAATLLSFTNFGGEGFEIYLNNKLVIQKFGSEMKAVQRLALDRNSMNDQLIVKYHHCGHIAKNRLITIKDSQNKILKEWRFADATVPFAAMNCKVKDILPFKKESETVLQLYYSSSELPGGRLLTSIILEDKHIAVKN